MKAVKIHAHGGAAALRYEELADPRLESPGDVIVKVRAAAVNRIDLAVGSRQSAGLSMPRIPGSDGAGTVVALGAAVTHVRLGDRVCFYPLMGCNDCIECIAEREHLCTKRSVLGVDRDGTYAEYISLSSRNCFAVPPELTLEEAAALPSVYLALWRLLIGQAKLQPGESLLIVGAGGVGSAALVFGRALSAHVIVASSHPEKRAKAKELGAEHVIDRHPDWVKEARSYTAKRGVDVVVDSIGGETWSKSLAALARGGRLVTCGTVAGEQATTDLRRLFWNNLKIFGASAGSRADFRRLLDFFATSGAKPILGGVHPLHDAALAHRHMEKGAAFGKIVLVMGG